VFSIWCSNGPAAEKWRVPARRWCAPPSTVKCTAFAFEDGDHLVVAVIVHPVPGNVGCSRRSARARAETGPHGPARDACIAASGGTADITA